MTDKRIGQRRSYKVVEKFPLTDSNGCVVPFDRSRVADRRLNSLELKELYASNDPLKYSS